MLWAGLQPAAHPLPPHSHGWQLHVPAQSMPQTQWSQSGRGEVLEHIFPWASSARCLDGQQVMWETTSNPCSAHWLIDSKGGLQIHTGCGKAPARELKQPSLCSDSLGLPNSQAPVLIYLKAGNRAGQCLVSKILKSGPRLEVRKHISRVLENSEQYTLSLRHQGNTFLEENALVQMLTWKSHGRKVCFILYIKLTSSAKK